MELPRPACRGRPGAVRALAHFSSGASDARSSSTIRIAGYGLAVELQGARAGLGRSRAHYDRAPDLRVFRTVPSASRAACSDRPEAQRGSAAQNGHGLNDGTLTIPAQVAKNGRQHCIPLPSTALKIIASIPRTSQFLFPLPSDPHKTHQSWGCMKRRFDRLCGFSDWTLHDLRRTFSTNVAKWQLAPPHVVERILNHTNPASLGGHVAQIYNRHAYFPEMQACLRDHERRLLQLLEADARRAA